MALKYQKGTVYPRGKKVKMWKSTDQRRLCGTKEKERKSRKGFGPKWTK